MIFSGTSALFVTLFSAFLWGSWFQSVKHNGDYPITGFVMGLYTFSLVLVWLAVLILAPSMIPEGIRQALAGKAAVSLQVALCGASMAVGLLIQVRIMNKIGMILTNSLTSVLSTLIGIIVTAIVGKLPAGFSILLVALATVVLIAASFICQYSGKMRDNDLKIEKNGADQKKLWQNIALLTLSTILVSGYSYGFALGTRTALNPNGFHPLLCVALLATGSFVGAFAAGSVVLTRKHQWRAALLPKNKTGILTAFISACCHYGGNLLAIFAAPAVSVPVSFLLGRTSNLWTYFWGLVYQEYKGASKKTFTVLFAGMLLFVVGVLLLTYGLYR